MHRTRLAVFALFLVAPGTLPAAESPLPGLDGIHPSLEALYLDLHRNPEISNQEHRTAGLLARGLGEAGFEVREGVGGTGVVGVLKNGAGPTLLIRTDMDALPVQENTGLPYSSQVEGVMHACGHDLHMTSWMGAARLLASMKSRWKGTLVMVAQPAEELGAGAKAMLADGLYTRFPRPDFALALHASADLPAGSVGWRPGPIMASADSVDVVFHGKGSHGAQPHRGIDPILIASRFVVAVQSLVSRETDPLDSAVVTVGSFRAGTKHNIIPDEATLQMTVRAHRQEVREALLSGIERIARAEAAAAGAPEPSVSVADGTGPTTNEPSMARRLAQVLAGSLGEQALVDVPPAMVAEDFSEYGRDGIPTALFWLGAVGPDRWNEARTEGIALPGLHSAMFAPDYGLSIRTGATVLTLEALELLK